jgi:hypothetical protein
LAAVEADLAPSVKQATEADVAFLLDLPVWFSASQIFFAIAPSWRSFCKCGRQIVLWVVGWVDSKPGARNGDVDMYPLG